MDVIFWAAAAIPAVSLADRLLLWLERHGWVYWRKREPEVGGGMTFSVINEIQTLLSPAQRYVTEERERRLTLRQDESSGAPLDRRIDLDSGRVVIQQPHPQPQPQPQPLPGTGSGRPGGQR